VLLLVVVLLLQCAAVCFVLVTVTTKRVVAECGACKCFDLVWCK
jgi:hypothetical protein